MVMKLLPKSDSKTNHQIYANGQEGGKIMEDPGSNNESSNDGDNGTSTDSCGSYDSSSSEGSWSNDSYDSATASEQGNDGSDS